MPVQLPNHLPIGLPVHLQVHLSIPIHAQRGIYSTLHCQQSCSFNQSPYLPTARGTPACQPISSNACQGANQLTCPPTCLSTYLPTCLSTHLATYLPTSLLRGGVIIKKRENCGLFPIGYFRLFWISNLFEKCWPPFYINFRHFWIWEILMAEDPPD